MGNTNFSFPCYQCGGCCQNVYRSPDTEYLAGDDGCCRFYIKATKLCSIYETRPEICRVSDYYIHHLQHVLSWSEYVALNLLYCEEFDNQIKSKLASDG